MPDDKSSCSSQDTTVHESNQNCLKSVTFLAATIKRFTTNLKKSNQSRLTKAFLISRSDLLYSYWKQFCDQNQNLTLLVTEEEALLLPYFIEDEYTKVEDSYLDADAYIKQKTFELFPDERTHTSTPNAQQFVANVSSVNLPSTSKVLPLEPIAIPKFSGDYQMWPSFFDLFKSLVHDNKELAAVEKLHYLKTNLTGEAEKLMRNLHITSLNYEPAWERLVNRYNNKRILINAQLDLIFDIPTMRSDSASAIKHLIDSTTECTTSLQGLGIDTSTWDSILIHVLVRKLTSDMHHAWERSQHGSREPPTFCQLREFLESTYLTLEIMGKHQKAAKEVSRNANQNASKKAYHTTSSSSSSTPSKSSVTSCAMCHKDHSIRNCEQFKEKTPASRFEVAKQLNLCINCLSTAHSSAKCTSNKRCSHCHKKHHTLIHFPKGHSSNSTSSSATVNTAPNNSNQITSCHASDVCVDNINTYHSSDTNSYHVILSTALVRITSDSGNEIMARALIDQGSEGSFITENIARRLQLEFNPTTTIVSGIGEGKTQSMNKTNFLINPYFQNNLNLRVHAYILKSISGTVPSSRLQIRTWDHTSHLQLADPQFDHPGKIDLLLGVDVFSHIIMDGVLKGAINTPIAQRTSLGWILSGQALVKTNIQSNITLTSLVGRVSLENQLKRFWELEELPAKKILTDEEQQCEKIFIDNVSRTSDGRFIVKLPFVKEFGSKIFLGQSKTTAVSRLHQLERRFHKNQEFHSEYSNCLKEYVELSQMEPVKSSEDELATFSNMHKMDILQGYYIPHHAVVKEASTTTKTRVVFDASRISSSGKSLNECLLNGPTLQEDITSIILRWRKYKVVIMADIEKMYRQIRVSDSDADFQRIVWRWTLNEPMKEYRLLTLTFGTKPAAYLAVKCVQTLAQQYQEQFPQAADSILRDFYVDDLLTGSDNIEDAITKRKQVTDILRLGGFELRKWASNHSSLLQDIPIQNCETKLMLSFENNSIKTLGLFWDPSSDSFSFRLSFNFSKIMTKRTILSDVAKLYDPNGWLSPVTIRAKILLQDMWLAGLSWDEPIPSNIIKTWSEICNDLHLIEDIRIPRWLNTRSDRCNIQLHCFTDASIKAYAAAVYVRAVDANGSVSVKLLTAKTKVAPIKQVSIPRLELCGVVLGAKILSHVVESMRFPAAKLFGWTDSLIVLSWLRSHPSKWTTFIANRVGEIHRISSTTIWRHVSTHFNPADSASRGIAPIELIQHPLWWSGPVWLQDDDKNWPVAKEIPTTQLEERNIKTLTAIKQHIQLLDKISTYTRLIRCTAYIFRFVNKTRKLHNNSGHLKSAVLNESLNYWLKIVQRTDFTLQIKLLSSQQPLNTRDKLLSLNPILDNQGILRVGGRLKHAHINFDARHPIILSSKNTLTRLIINNYHRLTLHGGTQMISGLIRKKFWIIDARNTIRNVISKCVICRRHQATIRTQLMGQLPTIRTITSRPFLHTGVDYAGPFDIKMHKFRGSKTYKGYVCLFICMAIKSVHLELASGLTTSGFLAAFKRFTARRGLCATIHSDNGTNFLGASRVLRNNFKAIEAELATLMANDGTEWKFIPPSSPNFGGFWEAGIKSTKYHLKRVLGSSNLTFEEFTTILTQIEGVLNSRPLYPISTDPSDFEVLTPGHFLIGDAIVAPPSPDLLDVSQHRLDRWQRMQQLFQSFWKRWNLEYVSRMQQRPKWMKIQSNLKVDDMVLIKEENLPPSKWLLGRVVAIHPGQDHIVRVVTVRTKNGEIQRSVSKICLLPTGAETNSDSERK